MGAYYQIQVKNRHNLTVIIEHPTKRIPLP